MFLWKIRNVICYPMSISGVPDSCSWSGTPTFQEILSKLHSGTAGLLRKVVWDSCFHNPTENPDQYLKKINTKSTRNENISICKQVPRL